MKNLNPLLTLNNNNYFGLSATSPAIDASSAGYPAFLAISGIEDDSTMAYDIKGLSRPASITLKDVGCDEYTSGQITNRPLTLCNVGPSYLCSNPAILANNITEENNKITLFPNPTKGVFKLLSQNIISSIEVVNLQGVKIYSKQINSDKAEVEMPNFASGIYYIQIIDINKNSTIKKVIILW